jgi:predicted kinase
MPCFYIPIGAPGCGKTTYFHEKLVLRHSEIARISPDEIRFEMLDSKHTKKYFDPAIELVVWGKAYKQVIGMLMDNKHIYFDATNLTELNRLRLLYLIQRYAGDDMYNIKYVIFQADLPTCLARVQQRTDQDVPLKTVARLFLQQEPVSDFEKSYVDFQEYYVS